MYNLKIVLRIVFLERGTVPVSLRKPNFPHVWTDYDQTTPAQLPERFAPPPLALATLNWRAMLICASIGAVLLGVLWFAIPPTHPALFVSQFAFGLLVGMGVIAGLRVKGFWKRMLLMLPALAALILSETIVPRMVGGSFHSMVSYLCGLFFGGFLMLAGFSRKK